MIIATSSRHSKISIPKLRVLHNINTIDINGIYNNIIAIMLFIQGTILITLFRFTNFKQNLIKIIQCTQFTSNWFTMIGYLKKISKRMRIHKSLCS